MSDSPLPPIQIAISVPLAQQEAFDLFTARIATWWPLANHSITTDRCDGCFIEPFTGGRVYERARDGEEHEWGTVVAFEPPRRLVMTWHPGHDTVTEVEVRFTPSDEGTFVELEHRGWEAYGADAANARSEYAKGWPLVFTARFGEAAGGATTATRTAS